MDSEDFICVFTGRDSVPSLFDCLQTSSLTIPLPARPLTSEGGSERDGEGELYKTSMFWKGRSQPQGAKLRQVVLRLVQNTMFCLVRIMRTIVALWVDYDTPTKSHSSTNPKKIFCSPYQDAVPFINYTKCVGNIFLLTNSTIFFIIKISPSGLKMKLLSSTLLL